MSEEPFSSYKIVNEGACYTISSSNHSAGISRAAVLYKATHAKGQSDLFIVLTFKESSWGDSTLHCNSVLPLRRALEAKRE